MKIPIYTVDAFTSELFKGNPAAVCILTEPIKESLMQKIAFEMNLSETAFVSIEKDRKEINLRWMTPVCEVDLCGHATLAASHILWEEGYIKNSESINFHTRSGKLTAYYNDGEIYLQLPLIPQKEIKYPDELIEAIGGNKPKYVGMTKWNYLIELENEETVRNLNPNYDIMLKLPGWGCIVTAKANSSSKFDFISRFFAPEKGIKEDPVTGTAHCT
jgi:PhzF family phenazine biosynthesis protein